MQELQEGRKGFVFYKLFLGLFFLIKRTCRELSKALCAHVKKEHLSNLAGTMSAIKPQIDMNERHLARTKKRASEEIKPVQNRRKTLPPLVTPQEKEIEIEIEKEIKKRKRKRERTSIAPSAPRL